MLDRFKISKTTIFLIAYLLVLWVYVYSSLSQEPFGTGDSTQWIVHARYYLGQPVPYYLKPAAYAPVYPFLLALTITIFNNAGMAAAALGTSVFVLLSLSFFVLAKEMWNTRAGFLALVIGSAGQYFFLYATSWGAYPELLFLTWANLAVSRFVAIYKSQGVRRTQLLSLSVFLGLSLFTHFPSSIILVAIFAVPGVCFLFTRVRGLTSRKKVVVLSAFSMPFVAWLIYMSTYVHESIGYVENEAALYTRGVNTVWSYLFRMPQSSAFVILGIVSAAIGLIIASKTHSEQKALGYFFSASWLFSVVTLMCVLYLLRVQTEYTRFYLIIAQPLVLNLAGVLSRLINTKVTIGIEEFRSVCINLRKWGLPLIMIVVFLSFPTIHGFYYTAIKYYNSENQSDFKESIDYIQRNLLQNDTILTSRSREARLLESTGHPVLFSLPERASYRPWEHDRSTSADTLLKSSLTIENGYVLVKFEKDYHSTPIQPSVSVCRDGEYRDALWLRDSLTRISLITSKNEVQTLSIPNFQRFSHEVLEEPDAVQIKSKFEKDLNQTVLLLDRTVTIAKDSPVVSIQYGIRTSFSFCTKSLSIGILDPWGQTRKDTQVDEELRLIYNTAAEREMVVRLAWDTKNVTVSTRPISDKDSRIVTWLTFFPNATTSAKLNIKIITAPTGRLVNDLRLLEAPQLIERYNVKAVLLLKDENSWYQIINLQNVGFEVAFENNSYIVMVRSPDE